MTVPVPGRKVRTSPIAIHGSPSKHRIPVRDMRSLQALLVDMVSFLSLCPLDAFIFLCWTLSLITTTHEHTNVIILKMPMSAPGTPYTPINTPKS